MSKVLLLKTNVIRCNLFSVYMDLSAYPLGPLSGAKRIDEVDISEADAEWINFVINGLPLFTCVYIKS